MPGWVWHTQARHALAPWPATTDGGRMTDDYDVTGMWVTEDGYIRQELRAVLHHEHLVLCRESAADLPGRAR
ncbi:hypothetical protein GCM10023192_76420 [Amycolatopsis samaneae]